LLPTNIPAFCKHPTTADLDGFAWLLPAAAAACTAVAAFLQAQPRHALYDWILSTR
jgi:hypothetical protein